MIEHAEESKRRDEWLKRARSNKAFEQVLVGDKGETLADVLRWLTTSVQAQSLLTEVLQQKFV